MVSKRVSHTSDGEATRSPCFSRYQIPAGLAHFAMAVALQADAEKAMTKLRNGFAMQSKAGGMTWPTFNEFCGHGARSRLQLLLN